jgi:hypothetical protein
MPGCSTLALAAEQKATEEVAQHTGETHVKHKEERMSLNWGGFSSAFLRYALGLGFLSAVADRFGLWGAFGQAECRVG